MNTGLLYEWMRNEWVNKQAFCLLKFVFYLLFNSEGSFLPLLPQSLMLECSLGKAGHYYTLSSRLCWRVWEWARNGPAAKRGDGGMNQMERAQTVPKTGFSNIIGYRSVQAIIPGSKSSRQTPQCDPSPTSRCHHSGRTRGFLQLPVEVGGFTVSTWTLVKWGPLSLFACSSP